MLVQVWVGSRHENYEVNPRVRAALAGCTFHVAQSRARAACCHFRRSGPESRAGQPSRACGMCPFVRACVRACVRCAALRTRCVSRASVLRGCHALRKTRACEGGRRRLAARSVCMQTELPDDFVRALDYYSSYRCDGTPFPLRPSRPRCCLEPCPPPPCAPNGRNTRTCTRAHTHTPHRPSQAVPVLGSGGEIDPAAEMCAGPAADVWPIDSTADKTPRTLAGFHFARCCACVAALGRNCRRR